MVGLKFHVSCDVNSCEKTIEVIVPLDEIVLGLNDKMINLPQWPFYSEGWNVELKSCHGSYSTNQTTLVCFCPDHKDSSYPDSEE